MGKARRRTPKYAAWCDEAGWRINEARAAGRFKRLPADCWYWTDIQLPLNHIGDSDNRLKALHDLLHAMQVTPDDRWLYGGTYMRSACVASGECRVNLMSMGEEVSEAGDQVLLLAQRLNALQQSRGVLTTGSLGCAE
jgi:hypothetical protein